MAWAVSEDRLLVVQPEKKERYPGLLAGALGENVQRIVQELLKDPEVPDVRSQIEAWRSWADELRTIAHQFVVPSAQEALRRAAAHYDQLADDAEAAKA
jgi:hypothetical protein